MRSSNGSSWTETSSAAIEDSPAASLRQLALLIGLGAGIAALHSAFRYPLHLPGHHGLEGMALMSLGCLLSKHRWSATVVASGAAATTLLLAAGRDPLGALFLLLPGVILDSGTRWTPLRSYPTLLLPLFGGLAWASRPLAKAVAASGLGLAPVSLVAGLAYPTLSHLMFGALGALTAALLWRLRYRLG